MSNVKRISPSAATLRELYILSGNRCAFPDCNHEIIDENGVLVAELCHIEAALPGGERFNSQMTNEERAQASNLIFMCHKHHKITDNVNEFDVARLKTIKQDHENLFRNIMDDMVKSIADHTKRQILNKSKTFQSMNKVLGWDLIDEDLKETVDLCNNEFEILKQLDKDTRIVFSSIIERSERKMRRIVLLSLIQKSLRLNHVEIRDYLDILIRYKLISEPYHDEDYRGYISEIIEPEGWDMWGEIKQFCETKSIPLDDIIVELDFEILD
ncbi:hypothetical protein FZC76_22365 [Sutcliffiella horikoshii]|uniref:HNH endonuclease n=1 Tax=Sutcliffiella horikoshii TaxID=79883 RepID=A0A5D4S6N8_9BACI|nr:hypothetical protein [Sutcliffiella horikoshii]TYS59355.1 hypothetical protein FZC76_22365 [Sutcliffiella horikoshii]